MEIARARNSEIEGRARGNERERKSRGRNQEQEIEQERERERGNSINSVHFGVRYLFSFLKLGLKSSFLYKGKKFLTFRYFLEFYKFILIFLNLFYLFLIKTIERGFF